MYYITTPIPYTNARPHLGHLLEAVFNDTMARFQRRLNDGNVGLCMGLDQHGLKIYEKAVEENLDPKEFARKEGQNFKKLWAEFEIGYDSFVETTSLEHKIVAQIVWRKLQAKGFIYKKSYEGLYCKGCEDFYAPSQLEDGNCPIHKTPPIKMKEENYFFKLSDFSDEIKNFLKTAKIKPNYIAKEQINFVESGLQDISISREKKRLPWGIEVPGDENQVMYVWFEALINYLTGSINLEPVDRWSEFPNQREKIEQEIWRDIQESMPIDFMYLSKEIAKFHLVIWIGMLSALDLPLPKSALAHGMINDNQGRKFSKSLGNGVMPEEIVDKVGIDGTRFVLLHDVNVDGDTNFDWQTVIDSYNSHLANNLGNLTMRVTTLVAKFYDGLVDLEDEELDNNFLETLQKLGFQEKLPDLSTVYPHLINFSTRESLEVILEAGRFGNEILEKTQPWKLQKEGKTQEAKIILTYLISLLIQISDKLSIFLPESGSKMNEAVTSLPINKAQPLFKKYIEE